MSRYDVVVVGARCSGAALATLLAREGLRVAVVERATFPKDTLSSHMFEADALAFLNRLGVAEALDEAGIRATRQMDIRLGAFRSIARLPQRAGDIGGTASIRRYVLDPILARAAEDAGADVMFGTKATGLLRSAGRVAGLRVTADGREIDLHARLVVGADGRSSTVAELCGARRYNLTQNERFAYWSYFEGADVGAEPTMVYHKWSTRLVLAAPADGGLYQVAVMPELRELPRFRRDLGGAFMEHVTACEPAATAVAGARRVGKIVGAIQWTGFFREATGPGWVLVGDAGHFKDPAPGRGIGDAFLQVETLAPAIVEGLTESDDGLDGLLARWGRWRDGEFGEHYWLATDLGKSGPMPMVFPEVVSRLHARDQLDLMLDVLSHRQRPSAVFTPRRVLGAATHLMTRRDANGSRRRMLRELGSLVAQEPGRRWRSRAPRPRRLGAVRRESVG